MLRDRKPGITDPGRWGFIGGQREKGERPRATAVREIKEETGLTINETLIQQFVMIQTREKKWHVFISYGKWGDMDLTRGEGQRLRFVPLQKAFRLRLGNNQRYVLGLLREYLRHRKFDTLPVRSLSMPKDKA